LEKKRKNLAKIAITENLLNKECKTSTYVGIYISKCEKTQDGVHTPWKHHENGNGNLNKFTAKRKM